MSTSLASEVVRKILGGGEHIISHAGASQYASPGGGVSACGLAALNCARVVLGKEHDGLHDEALLQNIMSLETAMEIMSICTQWSTNAHLEVEDIYKVPIFTKYMNLMSTIYSKPSLKAFKKLLRDLAIIDTSAAVIITRPPEIIACVKVTVHGEPLFLIFDSHPRPCHPTGAGFIFSTSINYTANHLNSLLAVDRRLITDDMQWQAQLLSNFSGHVFVHVRDSPVELTQTVMESSLAILALHAEVAGLKYQISLLEGSNNRLEAKIRENEQAKQRRSLHLYGSTPRARQSRQSDPAGTSASHDNKMIWIPGNSNMPTHPNSTPGTSSKTTTYVGSSSYASAAASFITEKLNNWAAPSIYSDKDHGRTGDCLTSRPSGSVQTTNQCADADFAAIELYRESEAIALAKQREFEEEDRRLRREREALAEAAPAVFSCGICLEEHLEDFVARVDKCNHALCRSCVRTYVVSKVNEHLFPILCPICVAEGKRKEPEVITDALILQIGIEQRQYEIYEELQLASFGILMHCRQCKQSAFVDRREYIESTLIVCPFPKCRHAWCKACQQTTTVVGPKHSCDGSSELEHLMKQRGWKHCPGCKTPIWKDTGCNHMTCLSPGCNTHFCYFCGKLIIRSGLGGAIETAISKHFGQCKLFEDVPDH